ncbi:hypothetical protein SLEP1_g8908 [Rubroshorea leprosula]|uniref:Uncharacterized protein n=1 Tax=Rubroshorea leprosula TaxID=152421 RepID=A0AAV5ICH8_9ROSI|nr:hypothetical protein SLEP1_g8908 [Rubroshorea leprosula]
MAPMVVAAAEQMGPVAVEQIHPATTEQVASTTAKEMDSTTATVGFGSNGSRVDVFDSSNKADGSGTTEEMDLTAATTEETEGEMEVRDG